MRAFSLHLTRRNLIAIVLLGMLLIPAAITAQDNPPSAPVKNTGSAPPTPTGVISADAQQLIDTEGGLFSPEIWSTEFPDNESTTVVWLSDRFGAAAAVYDLVWDQGNAPQSGPDLVTFFNDEWFSGVFPESSSRTYDTPACIYDGGVYWEISDVRPAGSFTTRYWVEPVDAQRVYAYAFVYHVEDGTQVADAYSLVWRPDSIECWTAK
ncbi:MAG: hypothetical protein U0670_06780 [Anaerolineae bacterium]